MKKILLNMIWALALSGVVCGCEKSSGGNEEGQGAPEEYLWHVSVSNADATQPIGVFIRDFNGSLSNGEFRPEAVSGASIEIKTGFALSEGGKIYAYAPYSAGSDSHTAVRMKIMEEQSAAAPVMPRAAVPLTFESTPDPETPISLQMLDLAATLSLKVYSTQNTVEKISSVSFSSDTPLAGFFSFNIKGVDANQGSTLALTGYSGKSVTTSTDALAVGTDPETAKSIPIVIAPGSYTGTVTVVTDKDRYSIVVDQPVVLARASVSTLTVRIAPRISQDEGGSTEDFAGGELVTE